MPRIEEIDVSPELASYWLTKEIGSNRNRRPLDVTKYARDMREGRWRFTGDPIKFDTEGRLIDGGHRCTAVVESGTTQRFAVIFDLESGAMDAIDTGVRRTNADLLKINGLVDTAHKNISAIANGVLTLRTGHKPSPGEILDIVRAEQEALVAAHEHSDRAGQTLRCRKLLGVSAYFIYRDPAAYVDSKGQKFFDGLATGANLSAGDPRLALRNKILTDGFGRTRITSARDLTVHLEAVLRVWDEFKTGKQRSLLRPMTNVLAAAASLPADAQGARRKES